MSPYESWSLAFTAIYDVLTFGLLAFVAYEAVIKPRKEDLTVNFVSIPRDTKSWSWSRPIIDFVVDNRGAELRNVAIRSEPDFLGWGSLGSDSSREPRATSEYFPNKIPVLAKGARHQFFWCDAEQNTEALHNPFVIIIEYDNPAWPYPRRRRKQVPFDFSVFNGTISGLNERFNTHNVAQEIARLREVAEKIEKKVDQRGKVSERTQ